MARFQKGGVHTKKVIPTLGVALLFLLSGMFVLASVDESHAEYFDVHPEEDYIVKTGGTIRYESVFRDIDLADAEVTYSAYLLKPNGDKHAGGVSPSTWTSSSINNTKSIKVTAPETAGTYRLVVDYETDDEVPKKGSSQAVIKVVVPITLKAEVTNDSDILKTSITVMFWVDGEPLTDSEQSVDNLAPGNKKTVTYEWVTDSLSGGKHEYALYDEGGDVIQSGEFYIGHKDYQWASIIMGVLLVILIIALIYILRKPVTNYGKPKGRR